VLREACLDEKRNVIPPMMEAVQSYATIGEIGDIFRKAFSVWNPPSFSKMVLEVIYEF